MATTKFVNRARMLTSTTGTGSSLTLTTAISGYFTFAEAGLQNGDVVDYIIEQGSDFEIQHDQTYSSSGPSLSRGTPAASKVGGTAGTSKIDLNGTAQVAIVAVAKSLDVSTFTQKLAPSTNDLVWGHDTAGGARAAMSIGSVLSASGRTRRVGEFFWYFGATPPSYALVCDGSIVSRSTYADLWAFAQTSGNLAASEASKQAGQFGPGDGSTTFSLPDLVTGSEFIRSITSGRNIGTHQMDAFQGHRHLANFRTNLANTDGSRAAATNSSSGSTTEPTVVLDPISDGSNGTPRTASETRPRNIALLPCIVF